MRIVHNLPALSALNSLNAANSSLSKVMRSLSTGLRINSPADDVASFAISERLRTQLLADDAEIKNCQNSISLLQTAEQGLGDINSLLQSMRHLCVQACNDTLTHQDRQALQLEIDNIKAQIDNISASTTFNNKHILNGSMSALWSTNNDSVKLRVHSSDARSEGNFRVEISSVPGLPQIQKSNVLLLHQDDFIMRKAINYDAGVQAVNVHDMPHGRYSLASQFPTDARATATGVYGLSFSQLDEALSADTRNSALNANANVLFEVTAVEPDNSSITLSAKAHVLYLDGSTADFTAENITLSQGNYSDISALLGVGLQGSDDTSPDGALEFRLNDYSAFSVGDKFTYNINASNAQDNADTSIVITDHSPMSEASSCVQKSNLFKPAEPLATSAKVVFLIDNSLSMGASFQTVKEHISSFIDSIYEQGAEDVKVGIARYLTSGVQNSSYDWYSTDDELINALQGSLTSGSVDQYKAVTDTVANYDMSDVFARHIVLITDTRQERSSGVSLSDAQSALENAGITLSAVTAGSSEVTSLITPKGISLSISDTEWGDKLVNDLGSKIGKDAITNAINSTPLSEYRQFAEIFPDASSPSRTITLTTDAGTTDLEISPQNSMQDVAQMFSSVAGVEAGIVLRDDPDDGERGVMVSMTLQNVSQVNVSGDGGLVSVLGLRSNFTEAYTLSRGMTADKAVSFKKYILDGETGAVSEGEIELRAGESGIKDYRLLADFEVSGRGEIPSGDVKLEDVNDFREVLSRPQAITITQGDGKSVSVTISGTDSINDLCMKLNDAIGSGLGQSRYVDVNNFVSYVECGSAQGCESVGGTIVVRTGVAGKAGELYFSGDEALMRAIGLNTIQEASETRMTAAVYDAHSGAVVNSGVSGEGGEIVSIIPPEIDICSDGMLGVRAEWDGVRREYELVSVGVSEVMVHIDAAGNSVVELGGVSSGELGVSGVVVLSREMAYRGMIAVDRAVREVSCQRAKAGAVVCGIAGNAEVLEAESEAFRGGVSRLADEDMVIAVVSSVKLQILHQVGNAVLAQAGQIPQAILKLLR